MLEDADPDFIRIVKDYLEAQHLIVNHESSMDCSFWRAPTSELGDFTDLGDGAIVFIRKYAKGTYPEIEIDYEMSEVEIQSAVEARLIPLADPISVETFIIEDFDRVTVEPGGGVVIPYTVLCSIDIDNHTYLLVKESII